MANPKPARRLFGHPTEAMRDGERETLLYVACSPAKTEGQDRPDFLATIDVDPKSENYGKVLHRLPMPNVGDEISRLGWNTCMSCYGEDENASHDKLVVTSLSSSRIYVVGLGEDLKAPSLKKVIEDEEIRDKAGLTGPVTCHCLGFGQVMVSAYNKDGEDSKGGFVVLEGDDLGVKERWDSGDDANVFSQDFWYQLLTHNVIMSSSGWGRRDTFVGKTPLRDVIARSAESHDIHVWDFKTRTVVQTVDLGKAGAAPTAVRFLHDPEKSVGFVATGCGGGIFRFAKNADEKWEATKVISIPRYDVSGRGKPVPAMTTDLVLSLDDKFLYCCNWLHGDVRQYDITDTKNPKPVGQISFPIEGEVKGRKIDGGPGNLTLSLDGKRLYVSTSVFSVWDQETYPEMVKNGSIIVKIDVDTDYGGIFLDEDFIVDFANTDGTADHVLAKEMRYPGGDCTSDIFLSLCPYTPKAKKEK